MSLHRRWLLLAALATTVMALPVPDEKDTSSKLLGSSVVTSVSVVMGEEDGNDAVRRVTNDLPASTVDMLKPDGFQFYTVDEKGQLITRQMTESEIHSIIAAGGGPFPIETQDPQKVGDSASGEMKVADVVQNVQNVLKGELNKPATAMGAMPTIPGHANDEWSSILPSILGGDSESAPVTFAETGEPDQEPKRNATLAGAKPSGEKVEAPSVPEGDEKRPMIPVPVITADSVKDSSSTTESKPVYEMLNTISAEEVKEQSPESDQKTVAPTTQTMLDTQKVATPSINLEAPVEIEKPVEEAPKVEATTAAATVEEEIAEIEKVIDEMVSGTATPQKKPEEESETVFEKIPEMIVTEAAKIPETATVIVPSATIIVPEAPISEDEPQTETEPTKKPETLLTELADSVSSMISQVSEVMPSMVPIPQKPEEELIKRVEDGVTVKSKVPEATTETVKVSPPASEETKEPEIVMVEIKTPELPEPSSTPKTEVKDEEKVDIVLKDETQSNGEVPIVRVDITDAKPTVADPKDESSGESSVVRIQLTNPTVEKINQMIDTAPAVEATPVEIQPISFPEKIHQTPASDLIAGDQEVEKQEGETQEVTKDNQDTASTRDPVVESTADTLNEKKPEQVEIPQEKPEVVKEDETKSSMPETHEEKKPVKPVETENVKDQKPVEATTDKVEPVTQEKITESSVKIVESTTVADVEKVEEPVKETSATPPEVVVATNVDVQPMKAVPEPIEEPAKEEVKPEEKPVEETPSVKVESANPMTVTTEAKPEAETPGKDVESKPVAPFKSDEKPEEEKPSVIKESEQGALDEPAAGTPKPLKSEDKPDVEIPSKETEIEPLNTVMKPEEEKPTKNVESEPAKPVEATPSAEAEIKPATPLKSEEKPVEETPSKDVDSKPATPLKMEAKPVKETPSKDVDSKLATPLKMEAKPVKETPSKDVDSKPATPLKTEEKPVKEIPSNDDDTKPATPLESEEKPVDKEAEVKPVTTLKSEEKPVETPVADVESKPVLTAEAEEKPVEITPPVMTPLKSDEKLEAEIPSEGAENKPITPVQEAPSKNSETEPTAPSKSEEKPVEETPSEHSVTEPMKPLKSEEKPVAQTPLKNVETPLKTEEEPVKEAPSKKAETDKLTPVKTQEKPVEEMPSKNSETVLTTPLKSEEKPVEEVPPNNADPETMKPLKSEQKPEGETPSKNAETEPMKPLKSEHKPVEQTPPKNADSEKTKPLKSEEKPVEQTPPKNADPGKTKPSKSEQKPVEQTPPKNADSEKTKPLKSEDKPVEQTPPKNADPGKTKPLKSEEKPVEQTPPKNADPEKTKPLKSEQKPVKQTPPKNADSEKTKPLKSEEKPVEQTPSKNADSEKTKPLKSEEKPVEQTPPKNADPAKTKPLKSEEKPVEQTPSKNADPEKMRPLQSEEKPVKDTPSKTTDTVAMKPLDSEEKPVKAMPSKNSETESMKPLKSEVTPAQQTPLKNADTEKMTPLKSQEKPVKETPSKNVESEAVKPLKSEEKPVEKAPPKNAETEPMKPLKSEKKPEEVTLGENAEIKPMPPLKSEEKPQAENPSKVVENNPANDNTKTAINVEEPIEQAMPGSTQPDKQADHVPDVPTSAVKMPEKIETQTVAVVQDTKVTEKQTDVVDVKVETPEVKPEVVPVEETKPQKDAAEAPVKVDPQESTPAKDQVPVPLVRVDVSPEKNQTVSPVTEAEAPEADSSLKKTDIPVVQTDTDIKLPEVEEATKKTEGSQDSVVESSNVHSVEPAISESSSKAPEADKTEGTKETFEEPANTIVEDEIPEVVVTAEPASTPSPTVTKVVSEEAAKPAVKIEDTPPAKTQEVRIQVNDTAVLVTQQKVPQKVNDEKKKVVVTDSQKPVIEASSQAPERATLATVTQEQNDKPISQADVTKVASEKKKPTTDPFVKLGEKKPEEAVKTSNANKKKPEDKWTLIPQSEPIVKQQQTTEANKIEQPSVSLEAHQSSVNLEESTRDLDKDIGEFAKLCNELAFSFWIAANKGLSTARSLALSPFGMTSMLAMVFLGARGPTSGQMNDVLKLDDVVTFNPHLVFQNITDSVTLARGQGVANAAFVRELFSDRAKAGRILPFYKERAQQFYDGHIEEVNFASISDLVRRRTNLLVRRQTGGRIRDFVKGNVMSLRSPLAALSANVFQTDCTGASSEGRDGEMYFAVLPAVRQRKLVPVPATVWRSGVLAGYEPGLDATVVSLGGIGSLVSTIFALPGQQGLAAPGDSLDHLERRLLEGAVVDGVWDRLLKVLIPRLGLEVQVPKFSHRSVVNATAALKRMGLDELFSRHADLKGVNGIGNDLHLADMLQINLFSTCGDEVITGGRHHVEIYPASPFRGARDGMKSSDDLEEAEDTMKTDDDSSRVRRSPDGGLTAEEQLIADVGEDRAFRSPLTAASKGKQTDRPLLKLDRPFLYFVRHNPTGMILHMGRFNPRLMP